MSSIELTWLLDVEDEDRGQQNLLAAYYREVANGPMTDYRRILQSGNKQGQNYYVHVLDGIGIFHKLRTAEIVEINDLEESLLFAAYTIHDMNKIPPYGSRGVKLSYIDIVTTKNIRTELDRIDFRRFFPEWEEYVEDIRLLALLHQHDSAPLVDLDQHNHDYKLVYGRLLELGKLMYAVDNLDLSHTLSENTFKENFLATINALSKRRWCWVTHRLGENRALLSNIIHNTVVVYLKEQYIRNDKPIIADMLYYPDGVAYLLPERETFTWDDNDNEEVAKRLAQTIADKKRSGLYQFIKLNQLGIKVAQAAIDSGASYTDIMYVIRKTVDRKLYKSGWHNKYIERLRPDIEAATSNTDPSIAALANTLLTDNQPLVPLEQVLLKRGELALAYRNLLEDHLQSKLKKVHQHDAWTHVYSLLNLPVERYALYNQVNHYRRGYFIARDCTDELDILFDRFMADLTLLTGEQVASSVQSEDYQDYLALNLEIGGTRNTRNFVAHLQRYSKAQHKQCCACSSPLKSVELMDSEVPKSIGVQVFSNRLQGGDRDPKRIVCPICRTQFILEKLTCISYDRKGKQKTRNGEKKNRELYTSFYLHLYPYAFFTGPYLDALYSTLKNVCHEDNQCFFLNTRRYFERWEEQFEHSLGTEVVKQAQQIAGADDGEFGVYPTKVNGINVPNFSEAVSNTPTLPLNAKGENYIQQFIFALTHALMIADFFGCRVAMSRTPVPLLTNDYMAEHALVFFVDGVPLSLRWLLPTNEYHSIETYRDRKEQDGGHEYTQRKAHWNNEQPDEQGYAAYENVTRRLATLYEISRRLSLGYDEGEETFLEIASALADDPLSVYHIVDLAIEKKLKEASSKRRQSKEAKAQKGLKTGKVISPEYLALHLSKRIAPLLAEIVKE